MAEEFDATLEAGVAMEQRLDWEGALQLYEAMLRSLQAEASPHAPPEARRTGRLDLGFVTLEKARERLHAVENWVGVASVWEAQAQLRRAMGDEERWREDVAEAVVFYDRDGMKKKADQLRALLKGKRI